MRNYNEQCLRNLQDRMLVFGFEGWDIFIVLGTALFLQALKVSPLILWIVIGCVTGFLLVIKRGKPAQSIEAYVDWFFKPKKFTAVRQNIGHTIKGRSIDIRLNDLQELLPYSHVEGDYLILQDDSFVKGYELSCPYVDNCSNEDLILYSGQIESFINQLTDQCSYQVFFTFDHDYSKAIDEHKLINSDHPLIKKIHSERVDRFESLQRNHQLRKRRVFLFVNYSPANKQSKRMFSWLNMNKKKDQYSNEVEKYKREFSLIIQSIESGLESMNLKPRALDQQSMMDLLYAVLNPDRVKENIDAPKSRKGLFLKQVCCSDLYIDEDQGEYLQYGGYSHKYLTLKTLPEQTEPMMLRCIEELSFSDVHVVVNFESPEKEWGRQKIESMRKREYGNITGMFGITNKDAETKVTQYETLLEEIQKSSQKLFRMQLTVHVFAKDLEQVKKRSMQVIRIFSSMYGCEIHDERWGAVKPMLLASLPGWTKESSRLLMLKSLHLADFLPLFSEFKGSGKSECLFLNTTQGLVSYDPFSDDLSAFNIVVVGASGSGKSFTINQIVNQYSKNDPIEIFIDIGGSYKRQVQLKGGEYIDLGLKEKFTINLFDLGQQRKLSNFSEDEQNEILIIKTKTIEQMMGGVSRFKESDQIVEDYIFRSIQHLYREVDYPVLSDLKESLRAIANQYPQFERFHESVVGLLGNWFEGGQYGKYTDGHSTISLDKTVICFDLKGLEKFERLQSTMLTIVTNFIWGKIMSEPARRKFVIFDECWKLLSTPEAAKFISECYRTFRKYGAGAISVTQSLNDFLQGGLEDAILGNSNTRFILRQNSSVAIKKIVEYFNFNEQERRLIETLQIKKGEYSEVFFSQSKELKHVSSKVVICPTPMEYWLATTDSKDLNVYNQMKEKNPDLEIYELLEQCSKQYPHGVGYENKQEN